jgi:hypothetical protein
VRALLCIGGNPLIAWPNGPRWNAPAQPELLVCVDIKLRRAPRCAHVIALSGSLERDDIATAPGLREEPYAHYAQALLAPRATSSTSEFLKTWRAAHETRSRRPAVRCRCSAIRAVRSRRRSRRLPRACRSRWVRAQTRDGGRIFPQTRRAWSRQMRMPACVQLARRVWRRIWDGLAGQVLDAAGRVADPGVAAAHLLICPRRTPLLQLHRPGSERRRSSTTNRAPEPAGPAALGAREGDLLEISTARARILGWQAEHRPEARGLHGARLRGTG